MGRPKGTPNPNAGRPAGVPNKATQSAREAIAAFVEGNVGRLNGWLDAIATGIPDKIEEKIDDDGNKIQTVEKWLVRPDPKGAYDAFMSVVEYNIPKLARTEVTGENGGPVQNEMTVTFVETKP